MNIIGILSRKAQCLTTVRFQESGYVELHLSSFLSGSSPVVIKDIIKDIL